MLQDGMDPQDSSALGLKWNCLAPLSHGGLSTRAISASTGPSCNGYLSLITLNVATLPLGILSHRHFSPALCGGFAPHVVFSSRLHHGVGGVAALHMPPHLFRARALYLRTLRLSVLNSSSCSQHFVEVSVMFPWPPSPCGPNSSLSRSIDSWRTLHYCAPLNFL